ncbi:hypothetical protein PHMEG_00026754 [Phytophthora megakarya]|uniref:Uncharacterized protein n=1 Tax=Phytophthora megakarya TaxID=4795 RepID=A0A225V7P2_9STRA|nr:hypothetical protein PHMEG_00026754 [Phytophthora megakarya]
MKCAFVDCINPEVPTMYPCSVCEREVHHVGSNELFDPDNTSIHASCVSNRKANEGAASRNPGPAVFEIVGWAPSRSRHQQASQDSESTMTEPEEVGSSQSSVESTSDDRSRVVPYGIPLEIHHYRQLGKRGSVWDVAHVLSTPYDTGTDDDAERFTHMKFNHTSNVKDHIVSKHCSHPMGKAEASRRVKQARRQLEGAFELMQQSMASGMPYKTVTSETFRHLMEVATTKPGVAILSAHTFTDLLAASFLRFCEMTKRLLETEYQLAYKMPFLNLMHDLWTVSTGKKEVIGTSMAFIDKDWTSRNILRCLIASRIMELYDLEIEHMARFAMSDTDPTLKDEAMLCGAPLELEDAVATHKTSDEKLTAETLTRLVLVRRNGAVCWSLQGLFKYVDVCQWSREVGAK